MTKSWGFLRSLYHPNLVDIGQNGAKLCQFLKRYGRTDGRTDARTDGRPDARTPNGSLSLPSPPVGSTITIFWHLPVKVYPCIEVCWNRHNFSFMLGRKKDGFTLAYLKMRFLSFSVNEMCRKLWGYDIITSSYWIFIRTGQEMFSENVGNFKMS